MEGNKTLKKREEIEQQYKWSLEKVYANFEDWEKEFKELKVESLKIREFSGKLDNKEEILKYLELNERISRKAEKLYVFAHMKSDEDTANQNNQ